MPETNATTATATGAAARPPSATNASNGDIFNDPVFLRNMKIAVVVMAVILILGFIGIIARIFYLSSRLPPPQSAQQPPLSAGAAQIAASAKLELPTGANMRSVSLAGTRLAVHYEGPSGSGIAIVDLETGRTISRVEVAPFASK
ncbi:MAG: hypothetical protein CTY20_03175 [Hyphomicrobium sp.]|nr:MAG: hypothetical protein CTY20_03175 [Hyphomicrobium sp.]